jgi:hypothetical protein
MIFKNSVRTAKKTQHFTITNINWLTLFKDIIAVYSENNTVYSENNTKHKYKMQSYSLLKQVVLYTQLPFGLKGDEFSYKKRQRPPNIELRKQQLFGPGITKGTRKEEVEQRKLLQQHRGVNIR